MHIFLCEMHIGPRLQINGVCLCVRCASLVLAVLQEECVDALVTQQSGVAGTHLLG